MYDDICETITTIVTIAAGVCFGIAAFCAIILIAAAVL